MLAHSGISALSSQSNQSMCCKEALVPSQHLDSGGVHATWVDVVEHSHLPHHLIMIHISAVFCNRSAFHAALSVHWCCTVLVEKRDELEEAFNLCVIKVIQDKDQVKVDNVHDLIKHPHIAGPQTQAGFCGCCGHPCIMTACKMQPYPAQSSNATESSQDSAVRYTANKVHKIRNNIALHPCP